MTARHRLLPALLAGAALLLSACKVDSTASVRVEADGSGSVTLEAVADAAVVQAAPGLAEDLRFDDAVAAGWTVDGPTPTESGGLRVVLRRTFATVDEANILLRSISGPSGPLQEVTLVRIGGTDAQGQPTDGDSTLELRGAIGIEGGLDAFADEDLLAAVGATPYADNLRASGVDPADAVSFRFEVSVPGGVAAGAEGAESDGGTLRWTAPLDGSTGNLATTFNVSGAAGSWWSRLSSLALVGLVAWSIVAIGFIAAVSNARKRRMRAAGRRPGPRSGHPAGRPPRAAAGRQPGR